MLRHAAPKASVARGVEQMDADIFHLRVVDLLLETFGRGDHVWTKLSTNRTWSVREHIEDRTIEEMASMIASSAMFDVADISTNIRE